MISLTLLSGSVRLAAASNFTEGMKRFTEIFIGDICGPRDVLDVVCVVFAFLGIIILAALVGRLEHYSASFLRRCRERSSRQVSGKVDAEHRDAGLKFSQQDRERV